MRKPLYRLIRPGGLLLMLALLLAGAGGCGSEKVFGPEEFVTVANIHGAGIELGGPLASPGFEGGVYELELSVGGVGGEDTADHAREDQGHTDEKGDKRGGEAHAHLGGSLIVTPDSDAGRSEFERCESAVSLLCYRAANVVVMFEDSLPIEFQDRVRAAIIALGEA